MQTDFPLLYVFIFTVLFKITSFSQEKISIEQTIDLALKNNIKLKKLELNKDISAISLMESKMGLLPTVNYATSVNVNLGRSVDPFSYQFVTQRINAGNGSFSATLPIFQGFQNLNQILLNKYNLEAEKSNLVKYRNELKLGVISGCLQILYNKDLVKMAINQVDLAEEQLQTEIKRFQVGSKTNVDVAQAKAQVANAQLSLNNAQSQLETSYLNLYEIVGISLASKFELVPPELDLTLGSLESIASEQLFSIASKSFPDIHLAKFRTLSAQKAMSVAKGGLYPRVALQGSLSSGFSSVDKRLVLDGNTVKEERTSLPDQFNKNLSQSFGLSITIPIANGLKGKSLYQKAKLNYQNARLDEELALQSFYKTIYQASVDVKSAKAKYNFCKLSRDALHQAFDQAKERYEVGALSYMEFSQIQSNLNKAESEYVEARYSLIFRNKIIEFYLGEPLKL